MTCEGVDHGVVLDARTPVAEIPELMQLERFYRGVEKHSRLAVLRTADPNEVLPEGVTVLRTVRGTDLHFVLARGDDYFLLVRAANESTLVRVTSADDRVADRVLDDIVQRVPPMEKGTEVAFWHFTDKAGPHAWVRELELPTWAAVSRNYPSAVRRQLEHLTMGQPRKAGGLIMWHGEPGTGKTSALRALIQQWSAWCDALVITDPEQFFGRADYLAHSRRRSSPRRSWTLAPAHCRGC